MVIGIQANSSDEDEQSVSDEMDSNEADEISISDDQSLSMDISSICKDTQDSEFKDDIPKFRPRNFSIKREVKKQVSHLFLFEADLNKSKEFKEHENKKAVPEDSKEKPVENTLSVPKVEKHKTQRNLLLDNMKKSKRFIIVNKNADKQE